MSTSRPPTADEPLISPVCSIFRRFLKRRGLKFTPERAKILDTVLSKQDVFEADALLFELRRAGHRVSKATIYRTLKHLLEANIVSEVLIDSKQAHYELSFGREPKSYLVCVETDKIVEFPAPQFGQLAENICREHGYDLLSYRFVVYGVSPNAKAVDEADDEDA